MTQHPARTVKWRRRFETGDSLEVYSRNNSFMGHHHESVLELLKHLGHSLIEVDACMNPVKPPRGSNTEAARLRRTLQRVMQILGPDVPQDINWSDLNNVKGLIEDHRAVLNYLRTAGIEWRPPKRLTSEELAQIQKHLDENVVGSDDKVDGPTT